MSSEPQLFEQTFAVTSVEAQSYDRVSRLSCTSADNLTTATLDVNTELYPCQPQDQIQLVLASTLSLDGTKDDDKGWREVGMGEQTLANEYDYVCHGKVYRFDEGEGENIRVHVSFGGLLLFIDGPYKKLSSLRVDYVYLLMKK